MSIDIDGCECALYILANPILYCFGRLRDEVTVVIPATHNLDSTFYSVQRIKT